MDFKGQGGAICLDMVFDRYSVLLKASLSVLGTFPEALQHALELMACDRDTRYKKVRVWLHLLY